MSDRPGSQPAETAAFWRLSLSVGPVHAVPGVGGIALAGASLASIVDGTSALLEGAPWQHAAALVLANASLCAMWALVIATLWLAVRQLRHLWPPLAVASSLAVAVGVVALVVQPSGRHGETLYWLVTLCCGLTVWLVTWGLARLHPRRTARGLACAAALASVAADLALDRTVYTEFHTVLQLLAWGSLAVALFAGVDQRRRASWPAWLAVGLLASIALASALPRRAVVDTGVLHGRWFHSLAFALAPALDRDGDGTLAVLWGADCNGGDPRQFPGAPDPVGDGRDLNCNGWADPEDVPEHRGLGPALGDPVLEWSPRRRVVLVTLDTFRPELLHPDVMPHTWAFFHAGATFTRAYANASSTLASMPYLRLAQHDSKNVLLSMREEGIEARQVDDLDAAMELLEAPRATPLYVHLHQMELHAPYVPHPEVGTPPSLPPLPARYVGEAMFLDAKLSPLWELLAADDEAVVLVTGDHGEGAGEHDVVGHTRGAWDEVLRVPLAIRGPGVEAGDRTELTSTRSVPATVLGAFGLVDLAAGAERFGRSLLRRRSAGPAPWQEFVLVETSRTASGAIARGPVAVLVTERYKLVHGLHDGVSTLWDLRDDPGERRDLSLHRPGLVLELERLLAGAQDLGGIRPQLPRARYMQRVGR